MTNRTPVPTTFKATAFAASEKQLSFIRSLLDERDLTAEQREAADEKLATGLDKRTASAWIERLLTLSKKAQAERPKQRESIPEVPAGRYAVENDEGELRFYKVWIGKAGFVKVYVLHGPDESALHFKTMLAVLGKIAADIRGAATRYGHEIGSCSNCGRRLTNRVSRELGIGPICGGRIFGDEFSAEVAEAREAIEARDEDPDEVIEDDNYEEEQR